jgi:hypothetical protein
MWVTHTTNQYQNNNVIGTNEFLYNQFGMKYFWQQIEDKIDVKDVTLINSKFFVEKIGIDIKSSVQLIYDIFTQMIEVIYTLKIVGTEKKMTKKIYKKKKIPFFTCCFLSLPFRQ